MAIVIGHGVAERSQRKVWPAPNVKAMAVRWFERATRSGQAEEAGRCSWCRGPLEQVAIRGGAEEFCSHDCAAAVRIAGLYLG